MPIQGSDIPDIVLIGAGIMSATLGTVLKELEPSLSIVMYETLKDCGQESSQAWNNAGTGHAANCELNYTPQREDDGIDISKALEVNTEFDISRQGLHRPVADVRHPRGRGLWRLPRQRHLAALRRRRGDFPA